MVEPVCFVDVLPHVRQTRDRTGEDGSFESQGGRPGSTGDVQPFWWCGRRRGLCGFLQRTKLVSAATKGFFAGCRLPGRGWPWRSTRHPPRRTAVGRTCCPPAAPERRTRPTLRGDSDSTTTSCWEGTTVAPPPGVWEREWASYPRSPSWYLRHPHCASSWTTMTRVLPRPFRSGNPVGIAPGDAGTTKPTKIPGNASRTGDAPANWNSPARRRTLGHRTKAAAAVLLLLSPLGGGSNRRWRIHGAADIPLHHHHCCCCGHRHLPPVRSGIALPHGGADRPTILPARSGRCWCRTAGPAPWCRSHPGTRQVPRPHDGGGGDGCYCRCCPPPATNRVAVVVDCCCSHCLHLRCCDSRRTPWLRQLRLPPPRTGCPGAGDAGGGATTEAPRASWARPGDWGGCYPRQGTSAPRRTRRAGIGTASGRPVDSWPSSGAERQFPLLLLATHCRPQRTMVDHRLGGLWGHPLPRCCSTDGVVAAVGGDEGAEGRGGGGPPHPNNSSLRWAWRGSDGPQRNGAGQLLSHVNSHTGRLCLAI